MPDSDYKRKQQKAKLYASTTKAVVATVQKAIGQFEEPLAGRVLVPDCHQYSGVIDGAAMYAAGIRAILIKYSDGLRLAKYMKENYRQANDNHIFIGSWHWLRSGERDGGEGYSVNQQARLYNALLKDFPIDMPQPYVDFERLFGKREDKKNANASDLWSFREVFRPLYNGTIGIYAGHYYWYEKGMPWDESWRESSLWMPRYKATQTISTRPWDKTQDDQHWHFWQFSETVEGKRFGFPEERFIDMSYWCDTMAELNAFCGKEN